MVKKPNRTLSIVSFPKKGRVKILHQHFPRHQKDLEFEITQCFINSLNKISNNYYNNLKRTNTEPADLECRTQDNQKILIQISEAVDKIEIKLSNTRMNLFKKLWEKFPKLKEHYAGLKILIHDFHGTEYLLNKNNYLNILLELNKILESQKKALHDRSILPLNKNNELKGYEIFPKILKSNIHLRIRFLRYLPENSNELYYLWNGTKPIRTEKDKNYSYFNSIKNKIDKHYDKPKNVFWLVIYSLENIIEKDEIEFSYNYVTKNSHPFSNVYYFYPKFDTQIGFFNQIYPKIVPKPKDKRTNNKKYYVFETTPKNFIPKWDDERWKKINFLRRIGSSLKVVNP